MPYASTTCMKRVQFDMVSTPDPHEKRRREILAEFPEVKLLMTIEPRTKYYIAINILLQLLAIMYAVTIEDIQAFFVFAYVVGGTLNHSLFLAIHELSLPRAPIIHACGRMQVSIQRAKAMRYMFALR